MRPAAFALLLSCSASLAADDVFLPPHEGRQGCWVSIFGDKEYRGPAAQLTGPTFIEAFRSGPIEEPDLKEVGGQAFVKTIDSLVVGPNARVIAYGGIHFSGIEVVFKPNARIPDLDIVNFSNRIESLKVQCVPV